MTCVGTGSFSNVSSTFTGTFGNVSCAGTGTFNKLGTSSTVTAGGQLTAYGGILVDSTTSGVGLSVGTAQQFQVDGTGNATTANLTVSKNLSGYTGSFSHVVCTRAFCNADLNVTGTGTFNSVSTNSLTTGGLVSTAGLSATGTGTFGSLQATGDLVYNAGKSLVSQMATLNNLRTSGTLTSTTAWQTFYSFAGGTRGFVVVSSGITGMCMGFFEWTVAWPSLTLLATSYNATQGNLNSPGTSSAGTQQLFMQLAGVNGQIQVKSTSSFSAQWAVMLW